MMVRTAIVGVLCLASTALVSAGCGCDKVEEETNRPISTAQAEAPAPVQSVPQVDLSEFDPASKQMWVDLANELLSPCHEPVSVARCVAEKRNMSKMCACCQVHRTLGRRRVSTRRNPRVTPYSL